MGMSNCDVWEECCLEGILIDGRSKRPAAVYGPVMALGGSRRVCLLWWVNQVFDPRDPNNPITNRIYGTVQSA